MRVEDIGEWGLIERLRRFASPEGLGLRDDCAVLDSVAGRLAVTTDALVDGVHFDPRLMSWRDIGFRALAASLSDLAATGASGTPRYLVALGVPGDFAADDVVALYEGMAELAEEVGAELVGGDTVASRNVFVSLTAFAAVGKPLLRAGAKEGQALYVSGRLGAAAAGLAALRRGEGAKSAERFLRPRPRLELGRSLAEIGASACDDVSDGLYAELEALQSASGAGFLIDEAALPLALGVPTEEALRYAYGGGEDFELVFTVDPALEEAVSALSTQAVPLRRIGEVLAMGDGLKVRRDGRIEPLQAKGFEHFSGGGA